MSARRVFLAATVVCAAVWLAKLAMIAMTGGTVTDGGVVGLLWAGGMLAFLVAVAAGAAAATAGRPAWLRTVVTIVAVPLGFSALNAVDTVAKAVYPGEGWLRDEVGLVVCALLLCVAAVATARHDVRSSSPSGQPA